MAGVTPRALRLSSGARLDALALLEDACMCTRKTAVTKLARILKVGGRAPPRRETGACTAAWRRPWSSLRHNSTPFSSAWASSWQWQGTCKRERGPSWPARCTMLEERKRRYGRLPPPNSARPSLPSSLPPEFLLPSRRNVAWSWSPRGERRGGKKRRVSFFRCPTLMEKRALAAPLPPPRRPPNRPSRLCCSQDSLPEA